MIDPRTVRYEPDFAVEKVAAAGMAAMEAKAAEMGLELDDSVIFASLVEAPDGVNAATHPHFTRHTAPEAIDVLSYAASHVQQLAAALDIPLRMTIPGSDITGRSRVRPRRRGR